MQRPVDSKFTRDTPAIDVIQGIDLSGKFAVITGGSTGLGKETARVLAVAGADIFIGARDEVKLESAKQELVVGHAKNVFAAPLDLADVHSVLEFSKAVQELGRPIDILIHNAGIMACPQSYNSFGIESQFATNYVGHALLTSEFAPLLTRAKLSRLVVLSSSGHHISPVMFEDINFNQSDYDPWVAYGQSKTADVLLAVKASKHLKEKGVTVTAVHPGMIQTELMRYMSPEEAAAAADQTAEQNLPEFKNVEAGSATSVWAATAPELEGRGPLYVEDCQVAPIVDQPNRAYGVLPYALDPELADLLWTKAEEMLDRPLPL